MIANPNLPVVLTVAGSDSCGGAGVQADLKTFALLGVHGASAVTAITAQNRRGVTAVETLPAAMVAKQIEAVAADGTISAMKTGMLANREIIEAVATAVTALDDVKLIVDPVMVATSGARLLEDDAVQSLTALLLHQALLVTPNLDEAAVLLGVEPARNKQEMEQQASRLAEVIGVAVLLKGGHLADTGAMDNMVVDVLVNDCGVTWFESPLITNADTHGTGCTLSAAITAHVAQGADLKTAIGDAKHYVSELLLASRR